MINEKDRIESRKTQIHLLDSLKNICDKHGLTYWIDFGTLLGAVRYKGFIPWDDDIDVSMPMKDYKKFLEIAEAELPKDVFLQTSKTDKYYKRSFAKLRDCYSTFLEHHESGDEKYHKGIYIDIFPSVYYPIMPHILKKILLRTTVRSRDLAAVVRKNILINYVIYFACKLIWLILSPFKSDKLGRTVEDNGYYEAIPHSFLYPLKDFEFEGKIYPGPNNVSGYLSIMYGKNYMTPPPPEKRIPHAKAIYPNTPCNHPRAIKNNMSNTLAPVAIFVYNRLWNTKQTVEALKNNFLAKDTDVYVFSDGPKNDNNAERVKEVRKYLHTVTGFKSFNIIERKENYYIEKNITDGVKEVINKHGKIIVLEDDGVTAKNFLTFMNRALDYYEKIEKVMHIATFTFIKMPKDFNKTFLLSYSENTGGGWATWKNRWDKFVWFKNETEGLTGLSTEQKNKIEMDGIFNCLANLRSNPIPWDICWYIALVKNGGLSVNSPWPLIKNNGLFNGTHFTFINRILGKSPFEVELGDENKKIIFEDNITENTEAAKLLKDFYSNIGKRKRDKILGGFVKILVKTKITKILKRILKL